MGEERLRDEPVRTSAWEAIPLQLIRNNRDSVRTAREAHLIDKAMTVEPHGINRRDEQ